MVSHFGGILRRLNRQDRCIVFRGPIMSRIASRCLAASLIVLSSGCGNAPSRPTSGIYAGQWTGTTSQGPPISFTLSPDQTLTSLTLGYSFNGCSGSAAYAPNVTLERVPTAPTPVYSAHFESGPADAPNRTMVSFLFTSTTAANGLIVFSAYDGCGAGPTTASWMAVRR